MPADSHLGDKTRVLMGTASRDAPRPPELGMPASLSAEVAEGRMNDLQVARVSFILPTEQVEKTSADGNEDGSIATWPGNMD